MNTSAPPDEKKSGAAPQDDAATPNTNPTSPDAVNIGKPLAWDEDKPTVPVPFDWSAVEDVDEIPSAPDLCSRYPELATLLREVVSTADASGAVPTPKQVSVSFVALCAVLRLSFMENVSLRDCAQQLGTSHETFNRRVQRWCVLLRVTPPAAKPAGTGKKISAANTGKTRPKKRAA